jgi:hypothetical protein
MNHSKENVAIRAFADQAKKYYREWLVYRAVFQYLKDAGNEGMDELLESARQSPELNEVSEAYAVAVDSKMPPSSEVLLDELLQFLATLPPTEFPN